MKRIRILLAAIIAALLLTSVFFMTEAEQTARQEWQADLTKLMNPDDVPKMTQIRYENTNADGNTHDIACEITVNGVTYGCEFTFYVTGTVDDWSSVQDWLGSIVTNAAATAGGDSETLAKAIDKAVKSGRKSALPDAEGKLPMYASDAIQVSSIRVSTPFYPDLSVGKNGEATKRLQERLIELGYLDDRADGYYGEKTKSAVIALENYIRELEQNLIDSRPAETPAPTEKLAQKPTEAPAEEQKSVTHELTLIPRDAQATPEPTAEPTPEPMAEASDELLPEPLEPVTQADGVADALLQAYIYSDAYKPARRELGISDSGEDVARLQRRLRRIGCAVDAADGSYGTGTARAVRIFQYYNGLDQTGAADMKTLSLVFSSAAKTPDHSMLSSGSSGDAVKELQLRLRVLGFGNLSCDGSYGASTQTAVKNLQQYMRNRERAQLAAQNSGEAQDIDSQLTVEVNGVADPMLLDDFYSEKFPAVLYGLQNGSKGDDVVRLQRRLNCLEYLYGSLDGDFGSGTQKAVTDFQKRNGLERTGTMNSETAELLFSDKALKALKPYEIRVSTDDQRVYVYGLDDHNEYTVLVKKMKCSTGKSGTPTPKGTYQSSTGPGARWHYFKKFECWAQYAYYIQGDIMFHSVLYGEKEGRVTQSSVNNLGRKASHGCVRLSVEDAKWIYNNCPRNTKVIVY